MAAPKAKAPPQETKTYYICPVGAAHRGHLWRGPGLKRHRQRCPKCPYEPFGVSYKTAELEARKKAPDDEAEGQGMDQDEKKAPVKRARHTFFAERAQQANAEWRAGRGRAVALKRAEFEEVRLEGAPVDYEETPTVSDEAAAALAEALQSVGNSARVV